MTNFKFAIASCKTLIVFPAKGMYKFQIGAKYDGEYYNGKKQGIGTMIYPDGSKYEGSWHNDTKDGKGLYSYNNGDTYEGFWIEDQKHGTGTYKQNATNLKITGKWEDGSLNGPVHIAYDGYSFKGRYNDGMLQGNGRFIFPKLGVEQLGHYIITKIVERKTEDNEEEEEEDFVTEKLSIWKTGGIIPIYEDEDDEDADKLSSLLSANPATEETPQEEDKQIPQIVEEGKKTSEDVA